MVVSERYPDLKANQAFSDLRVQLEGTENRITVARNRYIQSGAGVQRARAQLPDQPDGHDLQLRAQAQLHGAERSADLDAADGRLQQAQEVSRRAGQR
jgi:hypothetical protein